MRTIPCRALLVSLLGVVSCSNASRRADVPPEPRALPDVIRGANLRPVGDERRGYGTRTARRTMERLRSLGVNTVGVLIEGRLSSAQDPEVRGPERDDLEAARAALLDARALGLATVLVPHLYVDDGTWRGDLEWNRDEERQERWWRTYGAFIETAAALAAETGTSLLSVGVELKAMSDEPATAVRMQQLVDRVRGIYPGQLTYSANWDEAEQVVFWSLVDVPGVNGYYPLEPTPSRGAESVARRLRALSEYAGAEVLVLEVGYRSSPLAHLRPWEWPEQIDPVVDETSQADAWAAILTHWLGAPGIRGLMTWVVPTDPDDPASEPRHGFNPLNKRARGGHRRGFQGDLRALDFDRLLGLNRLPGRHPVGTGEGNARVRNSFGSKPRSGRAPV